MEAATAATSPKMTTVYLPGHTAPAFSKVTSAAFSMASPAMTPRAMLLVSSSPREIISFFPFRYYALLLITTTPFSIRSTLPQMLA